MKKEHLLAEIEEVLRSMPPQNSFGGDSMEPLIWVGRAAAVLERWDVTRSATTSVAVANLGAEFTDKIRRGYVAMLTLLNQARADLRMEVGPVSTVVQQGYVFDYFDELRKIIETARVDVFFVDPFLDADFVPRYLPHVADGSKIRLLGGPKKMGTLLPSVDAFVQQYKRSIQVRTSTTLHDRYVFVDQTTCYLSGSSFKDGARNAPAVLTQITDAFQAMWDTYEGLWQAGKVER